MIKTWVWMTDGKFNAIDVNPRVSQYCDGTRSLGPFATAPDENPVALACTMCP
jgi:hypothetical protein